MTTVELPYVTISFETPIVYFKYRDGAELGVKEMRETIEIAEKLSWNRPYFTFSDVRVDMSVTSEGRRYLSNLQHLPYFRGAAALVKGNMMSFAINFMTYFQKTRYPFKAFTDKDKALKWLDSLPLDTEKPNFIRP